jgi:hypothetical protein
MPVFQGARRQVGMLMVLHGREVCPTLS